MRRGIVSLLALFFCTPDLFGEDAAAVDAALRRQREILLRQQAPFVAARAARGHQPLEWFVVDGNADSEDPAELQPIRRARIAADWLEQAFFGQAESTVVHGELETNVAREVEWLGETYGLTAGQKQKLTLAGRGDIKRQFDRIDELKQKVRSMSVDAANFQKLVDLQNSLLQDASAWRAKLKAGQFREETLFAKTLRKILTAEQIARHAQWVREHPVVVTRSWDLRVTH
jgi:hypothetical protein